VAKRKRLTPAQPAPLPHTTLPGPAPGAPPPRLDGRAFFTADPPAARRPPIADIAGQSATAAAFDTLAQSLDEARREGRLIAPLPLTAIDETYLVRDRVAVDDDEMQALTDSLRARGQQTAIEVVDLGDGRWGLISGWRRLTALRRLHAAGDVGDRVLALVRTPADAGAAYVAMVEENEIRVGLSFYERARIVARSVDMQVYPHDRAALQALFHAASRPRRSKIGSFVRIVRALDGVLCFPTALSERAGLALSGALERDPGLAARLKATLAQEAPTDAAAEGQRIAAAIKGPKKTKPAGTEPVQAPALHLRETPDRMILEGVLVRDPAFRARLKAWLASQQA